MRMKNLTNSLKQKLVSKYTVSDRSQSNARSTDINILLNRVRHEKKRERKENLLFLGLIGSVIVVTGIIASL